MCLFLASFNHRERPYPRFKSPPQLMRKSCSHTSGREGPSKAQEEPMGNSNCNQIWNFSLAKTFWSGVNQIKMVLFSNLSWVQSRRRTASNRNPEHFRSAHSVVYWVKNSHRGQQKLPRPSGQDFDTIPWPLIELVCLESSGESRCSSKSIALIMRFCPLGFHFLKKSCWQ